MFGITPDLTCFGKIIGGGLPVGAYGGRREIMDQIAPAGPVYQAGTLSGNPLAMAAGIATLEAIKKPGFYESLDAKTERLVTGLRAAAEKAGVAFTAGHVGSMAGMFFTRITVTNFDEAKTSDLVRFSKFYTGMRDRGIYLAPSQFEALFVSAAHTNDEIDATIAAAADVLADIA